MSESVETSVAQLSARAIAQKAYKKGKKKRAKAKQAERKKKEQQQLGNENERTDEQPEPRVVPQKWCRTTWPPKATIRPVDDDKINELLEKRSASKAEKNYTVSDEITRTLVDMEIVYDDEEKQWHTRLLLTDAQKQAKKEHSNKRAASKNNNGATTEEPATKKQKNTKKKRPKSVNDQ